MKHSPRQAAFYVMEHSLKMYKNINHVKYVFKLCGIKLEIKKKNSYKQQQKLARISPQIFGTQTT